MLRDRGDVMNISSRYILCLLNEEEVGIRAYLSEYQKAEYLKDIMRIMLEADPADTVPWISNQICQLQPPVPGSPPDCAKIKTYFSATLLEIEPTLRNAIEQEADPLPYTPRPSHCGNYVDFGVVNHVDEDILRSLLKQVREETLNASIYQRFLPQAANSSSALSS